jgi:hypothetical protein
MLIQSSSVRSVVGRLAGNLLHVAVLLATLIAVHATAAEAPLPAGKQSTSSANSKPDKTTAPNQPTADQTKSAASSTVDPDVETSIVSLGSTDFRIREEAVRKLMTAGPSAIEPLTKAAEAPDLEVSYRAVRVLQSLVEQEDVATQQQAVAALEELSTGDHHAAADLATDALALYRLTQQDRALDLLRRLGAKQSEFGDNVEILLDDEWHGKTADLALLKQVPHLKHLRILYVKLDEQALKTLADLTQLGFLDLYGAGVSEDAAATLAQALPDVKIDRRNGALLGVGPSTVSIGCIIDTVVENSAAQVADIRKEDVILSIDGHPVQRFEELTALIGAKNVGDMVSIDIRRNGELLTKHVTLGKWQN